LDADPNQVSACQTRRSRDRRGGYWVFNALILGLGIGLNRFGRRRREARSDRAPEPVRANA
jgi:hypothetical protein